MATQAEIFKFILQGDSKAAVSAAKELVSGLDETGTAAERAAAQIHAMATAIENEARDSAKAVDALSSALGADFVGELERSGGSVQGLISGLNRAGISFEDLEAKADQLAAAYKHAADAGKVMGDDITSGATRARGGLDQVRDSGDQSRSVLANMVGNSVQDLGQLGGVAGTAGMALGQLAEYASEGNITLAGFAKVAGPMAAVAAAGAAVSLIMSKQAEAAADLAREVDILKKTFEAKAKGDTPEVVKTLAEEYRDSLPILHQYGMGVAELDQILGGNTQSIGVLKDKLAELDDQLLDDRTAEQNRAYVEQRDALGSLIRTLEEADTAQGTARQQMERADAATREWSEYLATQASPNIVLGASHLRDLTAAGVDYTKQAEDQAREEQDLADARQAAIDKQREATSAAADRLASERELRTFLLGQIDAQRGYEAAVDDGQAAIESYNEVLGDSKSTMEDIDDSARSTQDTLISQAEAFARSKGAVDGSKESVRLQIEELYNLASAMDPGSPLRKRLIDYIGELQSVPSTIDTMLRLNITQGATTTAGGDLIGYRGQRAEGGPTSPKSMYEVVERGNPEVYTEGGRTYLLTGRGSGHVVALDRLDNVSAGSVAGSGGSYSVASSGTGKTSTSKADEQKKADDAKKAADDAIKEQDRVQAAMFETGRISLAEYRTYLAGRKDSYQEFSEGYMTIWRLMRRLDSDEKAQNDRIAADEKKAQNEAKKRADEEADAAQKRVDAAYDEAEARRALTDATAKQQSASAEYDQAVTTANLYGLDKKRTGQERATANEAVGKAAQSVASTAFAQAEAAARAEGLKPGTPEYARRVREIVGGHITWNAANGRQGIADSLGVMLSGIPSLADGAVVMARPGGTLVRVGEAGRDEAVVPLGDRRAQAAIGGGAGDDGMHVHFHGPVQSEQYAKRMALQAVDEYRWVRRISG